MQPAAGFRGVLAVAFAAALLIASSAAAHAQPSAEGPSPPPAEEVALDLPAGGEPVSPAEEFGLAIAVQVLQGEQAPQGTGWEECASGANARVAIKPPAIPSAVGQGVPGVDVVLKKRPAGRTAQTTLAVDVAPADAVTLRSDETETRARAAAEGAEVGTYAVFVERPQAGGAGAAERKSFFESRSNIASRTYTDAKSNTAARSYSEPKRPPVTTALYQIALPGQQPQEVLITTFAALTDDDLRAADAPPVPLFVGYNTSKSNIRNKTASKMQVRGSSMRLTALRCAPPASQRPR